MYDRNIIDRSDPPKTIRQFYCHQMTYILRRGNLFCELCVRYHPEPNNENCVKVVRHFLSSTPRSHIRTCYNCHHPLMFICRAKFCKECHNYFDTNVEFMQYEDGVADISQHQYYYRYSQELNRQFKKNVM